jgi:FKBP-type peptidyl-prolyl cis-trans isomerase FkpA
MKTALHLLCAALILAAGGCGGSPTSASTGVNVPYAQTDLALGSGRLAAAGNHVTVYYTLWLYSTSAADNKGSQLQSLTSGTPFAFVLGTGAVIKGFDQGVTGMAVGGKRRLTLPPSLAYGSTGSPPSIPGNATLIFEIELVTLTD